MSIDFDTNCNNFDYAYVSGSPLCLFNLKNTIDNFEAGKTSRCIQMLHTLTSDFFIIKNVMGVEITPIIDTNLATLPRQIFMSVKEKTLMQKQIEKFY